MLTFPLARIVVGIVVCGLAMLAINSVLRSLLASEAGIARSVRWLLSAAFMLSTYYQLFRRYEKREITELSARGSLCESLLGLIAGALSVSLIIGVLYVLGYYEVLSIGGASALLLLLLLFITLSVFEEVIFRGIIYRITEESLGTNLALAISAVLFGLAHLANQHANAVSFLSAASGGILAGLLFSLTRRLWLPIFFHAGWNWAQASLGVAVSGMEDMPGVIESRLDGPHLITGGPFGPENSAVTILLVFMLCGVAYYLTWKRRHVVKGDKRSGGHR
jgi:membrane protease YdiL (CAAX protease family)